MIKVGRSVTLAVLAAMLAGNARVGAHERAAVPVPATTAIARAEALLRSGRFGEAARVLGGMIQEDPANRRAKEMLAFTFESSGELDRERELRRELSSEAPGDAQLQREYGRVLERSGDYVQALTAYRRARSLEPVKADAALEAAIDRMAGRLAVEVAAGFGVLSDPDAVANRVQAGAAVPLGSRAHLSLLASRLSSVSRATFGSAQGISAGASLVLRAPLGATLAIGPRFHAAQKDGLAQDLAVGGTLLAQLPLGRFLLAEAAGELETPWEDSAITVLWGGRTTGGTGRLYLRGLGGRLLLQAGARVRRMSIFEDSSRSVGRPSASQELVVAGADFVVWRKPADTIRGEMLDDALFAPTAFSSALVLAYRHFEAFSAATPAFSARIGLLPRNSVDELSAAGTLALLRGRLGVELRAGLGRDHAREAILWRAGGALVWAPARMVRLALQYEGALESVSSLLGIRNAGGVSCHVDL